MDDNSGDDDTGKVRWSWRRDEWGIGRSRRGWRSEWHKPECKTFYKWNSTWRLYPKVEHVSATRRTFYSTYMLLSTCRKFYTYSSTCRQCGLGI